MSMQIRSIILYNSNGEKRILNFRLNAVNIITGRSKAGKSSIINIIDYCLGRSTFQIAAGAIANTVQWYAVLYQLDDTQILIAKPKPDFGQTQKSELYYDIGSNIEIPEITQLVPNSNDNAVIGEISRRLGISRNLNVPVEGQSREPLEATLAHAKLFLFQPQNVIANREVLFYRQAEPFMAQAIKDTLPYFLGVIQEDRLRLMKDLADKRRELRMLRREIQQAEGLISQRSDRGFSLIAEAKQVGLLSSEVQPNNMVEAFELLVPLRAWQPSIVPDVPQDRLFQEQDDLKRLRDSFAEKQYMVNAAEMHTKYAEAFLGEASEQAARLESINLFDEGNNSDDVCPLCGSIHSSIVVPVDEITRGLRRLQTEVSVVTQERPDLEDYIRELRRELEDLRRQIQQREFDIQAILEEYVAAENYRDTNARIARVVGRVSYFLDVTPATLDDETAEIRHKLANLEQEVSDLESQLDTTNVEDRKASILNIIGTEMTRLAQSLELEHKGPYRLDLNRLTVIADRPDVPIVMSQNMGSAANHLGSHLIALLALHEYFIEQQRPVPKFLILDQPTQAYFPQESDTTTEVTEVNEDALSDEDRIAVERMFQLFFEISAETGLQIIILEHANLNTPQFQEALVDRVWRGNYALIPEEWLSV